MLAKSYAATGMPARPIKTAEREAGRARELADHREYERNIAQQGLLRRLEQERELAEEKVQFGELRFASSFS